MKGIARTVVQLIYGNGLQRWLLGIGLVLTLLGVAALLSSWHPGAQPLFVFIGLFGMAITVISPILVGAIMFRAYSVPRSVQLIPHGRLKLVLGAFITQLLLALFIGAIMNTVLPAAPGFMARVSAIAFSALTLWFLSFYWGLQFRLGACIWVIYLYVPPLLSRVFPHVHFGALLLTPNGLITVVTASALAWPLFAVSYIRQRHISVIPNWKLVGQGSPRAQRAAPNAQAARAPRRYGRKQAVQTLLIGIASIHRQIALLILILSLAFLAALLINAHANVLSRTAFVWTFIICLFAGVIPAAPTNLMTQRAKALWLTGHLGREALFMAVERQSWNMVLWVTGPAMVLALPLLSFSQHAMPAPAQLLGILVVPLTAGASGIYVSLLLVRGKKFADTVLLTGYTLLLMVEIFSALAQSPTSILPQLLAANIIAIPLLRHLGLRRWQNIDWLIHKRSIAQLIG